MRARMAPGIDTTRTVTTRDSRAKYARSSPVNPSHPGFGAPLPLLGVRDPTRHPVQEVVVCRFLREDLVRVENPFRVEQLLHPQHQPHGERTVLGLGIIALQCTQAMLGRNGATQVDRIAEYPGGGLTDEVPLVVAEHDRRVQVAVPDVADRDVLTSG